MPPISANPIPSDQNGDPSRVLESQARALMDVDRYADALPLLLRALASRPDDAGLCCRIAYAQSHLGSHAESLKWAERAAATDPENEWAHRLRAHALWNRKKLKDALAAAQEAARCAPEEPAVHRLLADLYIARNRPKEAKASAERARDLAPNSERSYGALAAVAIFEAGSNARNTRKAREYNQAAEAWARQGLAIKPDSTALLNQLALVLTRQGRNAEATPLLHASAQLNPKDERTRGMLNQNVFARFYVGWAAIIGFGALVVAAALCRAGLPVWPALLVAPSLGATVARPLFRRFGEGWMTRQRRFLALPDPLQATLRGLALDRKSALLYSFTITSGFIAAIPAIILLLFASKEPRDYADIMAGLNHLFHPR